MRQTRPLLNTHPEFSVIYWSGFTEYRVENWRLARDGSRQVVRGTCVWSWVDVVVVVVLSLLARSEGAGPFPRRIVFLGIATVLVCLVRSRFNQVLHESLLVFPTLGIQLETHRGHPLLSALSTTHHFIPLSSLEDVVIHEGFRRWNVRYYLAALKRSRGGRVATEAVASEGNLTSTMAHEHSGDVQVRVAFENILPYFPVLKIVYLSVQETLFPPPTRVEEDTDDDQSIGGDGV